MLTVPLNDPTILLELSQPAPIHFSSVDYMAAAVADYPVVHTSDTPFVTATPSTRAGHDLHTEIEFIEHEGPVKRGDLWTWVVAPPPGQPQTNIRTKTHSVVVNDLNRFSHAERLEHGFTTDAAGFEIFPRFGKRETAAAWASEKWNDEAWLKSEYYEDVTQLLKDRFRATSVFIFDHTIRKRDPTVDGNHPTQRQPVNRAHIDQSAWAAIERVRLHLGEEAYERAKANLGKKNGYNVKLVNVWRLLRDNVDNDWPLAFGDVRTFKDDDLVPADLKYPDRDGQVIQVKHNPNSQFYYVSDQKTDEAVLLKCFDLADAIKTPHTAVRNEAAGSDARLRWSIEVRTLVVTDPDA